MSKVDFSLIRDNNQTAEFKTIADHPIITALSGAINDHLTTIKTANGDVTEGDWVVLNGDGTVSSVAVGPSSVTTKQTFTDADIKNTIKVTETISVVYDEINDVYIFTFSGDITSSDYDVYTVVGTLSGDTFTFGPLFTTGMTVTEGLTSVYDPITGTVVVMSSRSPIDSTFEQTAVLTVTTTDPPSAATVEIGPISDNSAGVAIRYFDKPHFNELHNKIVLTAYNLDGYILMGSVLSGAPSATSFQWDDTLYLSDAYPPRMSYDETNDQYTALITYSGTPMSYVVSISGDTLILDNSIPFPKSTSTREFHSDILVIPNTNKVISVIGVPNYGSVLGTVSKGNIIWGDFKSEANVGIQHKLIYDYEERKIIDFIKYSFYDIRVRTAMIEDNSTEIYWSPIETIASDGVYLRPFDFLYSPIRGDTLVMYGRGSGLTPIDGTCFWYETGQSNVTPSNFFGIAKETVTTGQSVKIGRFCNLVDNQIGLTINTNYYMNQYGGLTTNTSNDEPYVGKSISDTEIIIKG